MSMRFIPSAWLATSLCAVSCAALAAEPGVEKVSVRSTAHFEFDKAAIRPDDQATILAEVAKMKGVTWQAVTATGHTDSIGPATYNEWLSDQRALAVKAFLVAKGLDPAMIGTGAKAAQAPVAENETSVGRAKNRRTEIVFQGVRAADK